MLEFSEQQGGQSGAQASQIEPEVFGVLAPVVAGMSEAEIDALAARAEAFAEASPAPT